MISACRSLIISLFFLLPHQSFLHARDLVFGGGIEEKKILAAAQKSIPEILKELSDDTGFVAKPGVRIMRVHLKSKSDNPETISYKYESFEAHERGLERYMNTVLEFPAVYSPLIFPPYEKNSKGEWEPKKTVVGFFMDATKTHVLYVYFLHLLELYSINMDGVINKDVIYPSPFVTHWFGYRDYQEAKKEYHELIERKKQGRYVDAKVMESAKLKYLSRLDGCLDYQLFIHSSDMLAGRYLYEIADKFKLNKKTLLEIYDRGYKKLKEDLLEFKNEFKSIDPELKPSIFQRSNDSFNAIYQKDLEEISQWRAKQ